MLVNLMDWSNDQVFRRDCSTMHCLHDPQLVRPLTHSSADLPMLPATCSVASTCALASTTPQIPAHWHANAHRSGESISNTFLRCCAPQHGVWPVPSSYGAGRCSGGQSRICGGRVRRGRALTAMRAASQTRWWHHQTQRRRWHGWITRRWFCH